MNSLEIIVSTLGILICQLGIITCYKLTNPNLKIIINYKKVLLFILLSILIFLNAMLNYTIFKPLIHYIVLSLQNHMIFEEEVKLSFIKTFFIYFMSLIIEFLMSIVVIALPFISIQLFDKYYWLKTFFSLLMIILTVKFFSIKEVNNLLNKLIDKYKNNLFNIGMFLVLVFVLIISYKNAINYSKTEYLLDLLVVIILGIFLVSNYKERKKYEKAQEKEEILLNFMKKNETIIDKDRINRHEMLNNLLILKSYKNKSSKEYEKLLDEIIEMYKNNSTTIIKSIYNLPSGLKGLLYYKLYEMENNKIKVNLYVSKKVLIKINQLESKKYLAVCKIIGILLDNAKESAEKARKKEVNIDIYKEDQNIIFYIENTYLGKVDIKKINEKNYSTKGAKRGLGLSIVKDLVTKQKFEFEQKIEKNNFITILTIK